MDGRPTFRQHHIGIAVDATRVIHAASTAWGVKEDTLVRTGWTSRLRLPRSQWTPGHTHAVELDHAP